MELEIKELRKLIEEQGKLIKEQGKVIDILQRNALVNQNKLKKYKESLVGIYELTLGTFKRLLARANDFDEETFNIIQWLGYTDIWCIECLTKFKTSDCIKYPGTAPLCPNCMKLKNEIKPVKLDKFAGSLKAKSHQ